MSRKQMMTFMEGRQGNENSSQRAASFGEACRLIRTMTCFCSAIIFALFRGIVTARPRRYLRNVHLLVGQLDFAVYIFGACRFKPIGVIAIGEFRFVMSASRLVTSQCAECDDSRQQKHIPQFARKIERLVGPFRSIAKIDAREALGKLN